ncbi:MAG: GH13_13 / GH13_37 / GH13_32 / GH13 / GH13_ 14 / GH13_11 [uncultured Solirubrobacteraceae bacterium]|uniref:GH13_13 / GH13_37 / GH13_32 / GH13 / GH13_ 14 / GH13_11 n=1 Tax=uncultured Solirubrobacteraceae bacterium TaxID=1162706 RepID=A0A6J4SSZ1_9ACTN|nr:MAG: GH13_13 / GH13_37 / GH13_32 / GH13 / GH13_ 14 / GH13_11 [uncultured Solirubrobacteraceae bacterium]
MRRALPVLVSCILVLLAAAAPARADHTPVPGSVTLVGALQSELGCPGDWQPPCAATALQPVAGQPGVFRGTFDVPAGSWEYKVALNGSWDENYGGGGAPGGANITLSAAGGPVTFTYDHATHVISDDRPEVLGRERAAHWLRADLIAWDVPAGGEARTYRLHAAPNGKLEVQDGTIAGGTSYALRLRRSRLPESLRTRFPHLAGLEALELPAAVQRRARSLLTGQLIVAAYDAGGRLVDATGVQIPGVLDDLYARAADAELGPTWPDFSPRLALWAPTAKRVELVLDPAGRATERRVAMRRGSDGVWRVRGTPGWRNARYAFDVTVYVPSEDDVVVNRVTDPYSLGLTTNSRWSVLVDLRDPALEPAGWRTLAKPGLAQPEDSTIYELHVRDFSITDETVPEERRGTYLAFAEAESDGMRHLRGLAQDGLNTLHLLPVNDIATIEEDRAEQAEPACDLATLGPASPDQQACIAPIRDQDGFNWGYDPLHYTTPEGSYATDPDGPARTREFREMVKGINGAGLRVVMDVVYNHTPASGQDPKSILDRIVPGYYQRLSLTGAVETSTCCANTASEHRMMEKLMVESVVTWARHYKVDGFRFDLMGHHSKANMLAVRRALDALTPARDGVDGKRIYVYGEGWNFGEVANNARFVQASQLNMAGTGIGTFSDRLRDAVRGGGPFDADPRVQGFATGLFTDPNGAPVNGTAADQAARMLLYHDQIKVGLAGNLRDFTFTDRTGTTVKGSQVDYNGQPAGYAADPSETITYVDAHDNETLFDALQFKLPQSTSMADRVRMNTIALSTTALAQSPSFWHAGADLLRSKSLDRNSYNSGDWFNRIDWSGRESTWGSGLPPAQDNQDKWPFMRPLLEDPALKPGEADIKAARARAGELLRIRFSSPLLRLGTAARIQERVSFPTGGPDQTPGVIVMAIDDRAGEDLDPALEGIVVVWNASDEATTQTVPGLAGAAYALHPEQAGGGDPVVQESAYDAASGGFTVPARTVAVFVTP